jgi:hypothetical protein
MPQRKGGQATTNPPNPVAHKANKMPQPTGTAHTKRMAMRKPWLAAMAVDSVVFGPGVKLLTVASTSRALSSEDVMALRLAF